MLLGQGNHELLMWCGLTIWFITGILSSSEEGAARSAPFVVPFLLCIMVLVVCSIYLPAPLDSGTHKPPTWYVIFMITIWATLIFTECWKYFRRHSPKDDDHAA